MFHCEEMRRDGEEVRQQQQLWLQALCCSPPVQRDRVARWAMFLCQPGRISSPPGRACGSLVLHLLHSPPQQEPIPANLSGFWLLQTTGLPGEQSKFQSQTVAQWRKPWWMWEAHPWGRDVEVHIDCINHPGDNFFPCCCLALNFGV